MVNSKEDSQKHDDGGDVTNNLQQTGLNCLKCKINFDDVKLLKTHYWKVHIAANEIGLANGKLKSLNDGKVDGEPKAKKRAVAVNKRLNSTVDDDDDDAESSVGGQENAENAHEHEAETAKLIQRLNEMNDLEFRTFNVGMTIDETEVFQRVAAFYPNYSSNKLEEMRNGTIGWADWRHKSVHVMWPCIIEKFSKKSTNKQKISIRYFQVNDKPSAIFKLDKHKVELFFANEEHFNYKIVVGNLKALRYDFFICYTEALKKFVKSLEERENSTAETTAMSRLDETVDSEMSGSTAKSASKKSNNNNNSSETYLCSGKMLTKEEIQELATRPYSSEQLKVNSEREAYSKKLFNTINTDECKEFLKSIFEETFVCKRHEAYLKASNYSRRKNKLKFSSPGPLAVEQQQELAKLVLDLSKTYYVTKPPSLDQYEYDVLYPEAIIWGLRRMDNMSYTRAERKYEEGFKRTPEELLKEQCNEILNEQIKPTTSSATVNEDEGNNKMNASPLINISSTTSDKNTNEDTHMDCDFSFGDS